MSILLIRHGETALNVARTVQPADTPLSPRGLAQAEALARRMATLGLAAIVSSDLPRAWRTAEALAVTTGLRVEPSALLHERNFGDLRGRPYDSMGFDPLHMVDAPPNGESAEAFRQRVTDAFGQTALHARRPARGGDAWPRDPRTAAGPRCATHRNDGAGAYRQHLGDGLRGDAAA